MYAGMFLDIDFKHFVDKPVNWTAFIVGTITVVSGIDAKYNYTRSWFSSV